MPCRAPRLTSPGRRRPARPRGSAARATGSGGRPTSVGRHVDPLAQLDEQLVVGRQHGPQPRGLVRGVAVLDPPDLELEPAQLEADQHRWQRLRRGRRSPPAPARAARRAAAAADQGRSRRGGSPSRTRSAPRPGRRTRPGQHDEELRQRCPHRPHLSQECAPAPHRRQRVGAPSTVGWSIVRLVIARCSVDYDGRLTAHLPLATRLLLVKADGSVLVHSDGGSYKPLNWMSPAVRHGRGRPDEARPPTASRRVGRAARQVRGPAASSRSTRCSTTPPTSSASTPAWSRTASRRTCRSCSPSRSRPSATAGRLVRREYMTPIGPVDILCRDAAGAHRRDRDQAARRDRRRRAADPLPRADEPRPAPRAGPRRLRRPGDQAAGPHARRGPRHPLRGARLRRAARRRRREHRLF